MSETIHATCVAIDGRGVLIGGRSGSGKSDLALRLIDRGAQLVSDDYTDLCSVDGRLVARAPARIAGRMEIRGVGLVEIAAAPEAPVCLFVDLDSLPDRLPEPKTRRIAGQDLPTIALAALEPSAPLKLERALLLFGLPPA